MKTNGWKPTNDPKTRSTASLGSGEIVGQDQEEENAQNCGGLATNRFKNSGRYTAKLGKSQTLAVIYVTFFGQNNCSIRTSNGKQWKQLEKGTPLKHDAAFALPSSQKKFLGGRQH